MGRQGLSVDLNAITSQADGAARCRVAVGAGRLSGIFAPFGCGREASAPRWAGPQAEGMDLVQDADVDLHRYLSVLFQRARASTLVEVRWRAGTGMHRRFITVKDIEVAAREARRRAESTDVFVGVLPRWRQRGDRGGVAGAARTVWVDLDVAAAAGALEAVGPRPHLVVASGGPGHVHAYWSLAGAVAPWQVERANRRLAWALGGDLQCTDAPRILRPPSTINHGRDGVPVRLIAVSDGPPTTLAALVGGLPDPPVERPRASRRSGHGLPLRDPLLAVTPERYVQVLTGQSVGRSRKVRCPLHADGTPSLHVYEDPADGWYCFGCGRGGSVYDLAAGVWDITPRGDGFTALRAGLRHKLGLN